MTGKDNDYPSAESISRRVRRFYTRHPYPPPRSDLDDYRRRWQDESRRRADYHLHWPCNPYRERISILVAGCGTSQAVRHALRNPAASVVGIDISPTSIRYSRELQRKYQLNNLELHQLPIERAGELDAHFDQIICTGVLHHLPDPDAGLRLLGEMLKPDGALHLMVYAAYGRIGVYMLQEYAGLLQVGDSGKEIADFANTLMALPQNHPLARLLAESPDFRSKAGLADALLNPQDRAFTVPQLFDWLSQAGIEFGRWLRQAPYLPQCGAFAKTPHSDRLSEMPPRQQFAALELLRGTMLRHNFVAYRQDLPGGIRLPAFEGQDWLGYVPIRLADTIRVNERLPQGAAAVLLNKNHAYPDIYLPIDAAESRIFESIDGCRSIAEILESTPVKSRRGEVSAAAAFFQRLWWNDLVVFDISRRAAAG